MNTREQIILESLRSFVNEGYEKTSISLIADKCGMTKGAVYHHFHAKKDLLEAAIDLFYQDHENWLMKKLAQVQGLREILSIFFNYHTYTSETGIFSGGDANVYRLLIDAVRNFPDLKTSLIQRYRDYFAKIKLIIEDAISQGTFKKDIDPEIITLELVALFEGFIVMDIMLGEGFIAQEKKEAALDSLWERIRA